MKFIFFLAIVIAAQLAEASYDVSIITINKETVIEIIQNGKVCHYVVDKKDLKITDSKGVLCLSFANIFTTRSTSSLMLIGIDLMILIINGLIWILNKTW